MNTAAIEKFLAHLYTDAAALERFLRSPRDEAARAGLGTAECDALAGADMTGMQMAARSFSHKRAGKMEGAASGGRWGWQAIRRLFGR
jgi:hypothetical protein